MELLMSSLLLDTAGEMAAPFIGRVPKTGVLDTFEFRLGKVRQAPVNGIRCSFQDLTVDDPNGTHHQFRVVTDGLTTNAWVVPGLITSDGTDGGDKLRVTEYDLLACVVEFENFAVNDALFISTTTRADGSISRPIFVYPIYHIGFFSHVWTRQEQFPCIALKYDDGSYANFLDR